VVVALALVAGAESHGSFPLQVRAPDGEPLNGTLIGEEIDPEPRFQLLGAVTVPELSVTPEDESVADTPLIVNGPALTLADLNVTLAPLAMSEQLGAAAVGCPRSSVNGPTLSVPSAPLDSCERIVATGPPEPHGSPELVPPNDGTAPTTTGTVAVLVAPVASVTITWIDATPALDPAVYVALEEFELDTLTVPPPLATDHLKE
jgi:hypothetical protein